MLASIISDPSRVFWKGYDGTFQGFGNHRTGTIYDYAFTHKNGEYANALDRVKAREAGGERLNDVSDYAPLELTITLQNTSDAYRVEALVTDGVVYYQIGADPTRIIEQLNSTSLYSSRNGSVGRRLSLTRHEKRRSLCRAAKDSNHVVRSMTTLTSK